MQLKDAIDQYSEYRLLNRRSNTVAAHQHSLRRFCLFLRNPLISTVTLDHVIEYLSGMRELGWNQNTIREQATIFRQFFRYCRLTELSPLHEDLIPLPRKQPMQHRVVTDEEHQALLGTLTNLNDPRIIRNRAILTLLHDTGMRNGELTALKVSELNLTRKKCTIRTEKDRSDDPWRQVFWTDHAHEPLLAWLKKRDYLITEKRMFVAHRDHLFFGIAGPSSGQPLSQNALDMILKACSRRAGIRNINPHAYRHRFGHRLADMGMEDSAISSLMGHASPVSSFGYTRSSGTRLEKKYRQFHS